MPIGRTSRRGFVASLAALAAGPAGAQTGATEAEFPRRPVRVIVSFAPGGGVDAPVRAMARVMGAVLGQPLVIENRGGGSGSIGAAAVAASPPDGCTVLTDASGPAVNPALMPNLPFDYARDLAPVGMLTIIPQVLVVPPDSAVRSVAVLVARAKAQPGRISFASSGVGNGPHLAATLFAQRAGFEVVHVPYRGGAPAVADVVARHVGFMFSTMPGAAPLVRDGRLRALAVTMPERRPAMPDVPTMAEAGFPGFVVNKWSAMWVPSGTPAAVVRRLSAALTTAMADPGVRSRLDAIGIVPVGGTPEALGAFVARERESMAALIHSAGVRLE